MILFFCLSNWYRKTKTGDYFPFFFFALYYIYIVHVWAFSTRNRIRVMVSPTRHHGIWGVRVICVQWTEKNNNIITKEKGKKWQNRPLTRFNEPDTKSSQSFFCSHPSCLYPYLNVITVQIYLNEFEITSTDHYTWLEWTRGIKK